MQSYKYVARDLAGNRKEGFTDAIHSSDVVSWLRGQSFTPVFIGKMSAQVSKPKRTFYRKQIRSADLSAICWQLTTMVEGGITITSAMEIISEDIENTELQKILQQIVEEMEKGETFSQSISKFPRVFNQLSYAIVLAGETSGNLAESLRRLAEYFENRDKLAKKVKAAIAYPAFVFGFIILIVIFIMAFIIPRFSVIFDQIGGELPAFTRAFMGFYDLLCNNLHYFIGSILLLIVSAVFAYTKTDIGHCWFSKIALAVPLVGRIFREAFIAIFCRTMSTLLAAGVSVLEVFDILAAMTNNDVIKSAIIRTRENIVEGANVSLSMSESQFFPNLVVKMVQVGEKSGSLSRVLDRTAEYYERRVDAALKILMSLLEPIMIVTVGAIVLVVVLALYLPIFTMSDIAK